MVFPASCPIRTKNVINTTTVETIHIFGTYFTFFNQKNIKNKTLQEKQLKFYKVMTIPNNYMAQNIEHQGKDILDNWNHLK